jgi:hypothetical protein
MSQVKSTFTISAENLAFFTGAPRLQESDKVGARDKRKSSDAWASLIEQLVSWAQGASQITDDDIIAPSSATISRATTVAVSLRDQGAPAPTRIVPTGDGGIAFQYDGRPQFISIEVEPEGPVELLIFNEGRLTHRADL